MPDPKKQPQFVQPPRGKSIVGSYPTPAQDAVIVLVKDTQAPSYSVPAYGTPHEDTNKYAGYKLSQVVPDSDAQTAKWFYVADRVDQDTYNFALKFSGENHSANIYVRTYILPRDGYTPLANGTADSADTSAVLAHEEVLGAADGELAGLYIKVVRIFEVLPGPWLISTQIGEDGTVTTVKTRRNLDSAVTSSETLVSGVWTKNYKKATDSSFVTEEVSESQTLPGRAVLSTKIDQDGAVISISKTLKDTSTITSAEAIVSGVWKRTYKEAVTDLVANEVIESRPVPGNAILSQLVDPDGGVVSVSKTLKDQTTITCSETLVSGLWKEVVKEPVSDLVAYEVVKSRAIPGGSMVVSKLEVDGTATTVTRTLKAQGSITAGETLVSSVWTRVTKEDPPVFRGFALRGGDLVAWEIVETRTLPGNAITVETPDKNGDITTETRQLVATSSANAAVVTQVVSSVWTQISSEPFSGSSLVAWKVTRVRPAVTTMPEYTIEIRDLVPPEFAAAYPPTTTETRVTGTASLPTLGTGDLRRTQKQIDQQTYLLIVTTRGGITLPATLTNKRYDEQFGGGDIDEVITLATAGSQTVDEGTTILSSKVVNLGNGQEVKTTQQLHTGSWPALSSQTYERSFDLVIPKTEQVVAAGTALGTAKVTIEPIDKYRQKNITFGGSSVNAVYDAYFRTFPGTINIDVPPELVSISSIWSTSAANGLFSNIVDAYSFDGAELAQTLRGSARAAVGAMPELGYVIKQPWTNNVPCLNAFVFMPFNFTLSQLLTKLTTGFGLGTINAWPKFVPVPLTFICKGLHISASNQAEAGFHVSQRVKYDGTVVGGVNSSSTRGQGYSNDLSINNKDIRLSPTIHPSLTLSTATQPQTATCSVTINNPVSGANAFSGSGIDTSSAPAAITSPNFSTGTTIPATGDDISKRATIPVAGYYLWRYPAEPAQDGYMRVHCEVVNFADIT